MKRNYHDQLLVHEEQYGFLLFLILASVLSKMIFSTLTNGSYSRCLGLLICSFQDAFSMKRSSMQVKLLAQRILLFWRHLLKITVSLFSSWNVVMTSHVLNQLNWLSDKMSHSMIPYHSLFLWFLFYFHVNARSDGWFR